MHSQSTVPYLQLQDREPFEPELIVIPAGEFLMGEKRGLAERAVEISPLFEDAYVGGVPDIRQHVHLPAFAIAKTPVTNEQYAAYLQDTGHDRPRRWRSDKGPRGKESFPVVFVTWHDAVAYCRWLAEASQKPFRLPTEAEWEKAARGTNGRAYPWGNRWEEGRCNTVEAELNGITAVDAYPRGASPYGLLDMAGNVWEWTASLWGSDWYRADYGYPYDASDGREDPKAGDDICRVLRGGSFAYAGAFARCAYRYKHFPQNSSDGIGFRVAVTVPLPVDEAPLGASGVS
jgi:formylglycine-generating enzyme required for sulfatase activity